MKVIMTKEEALASLDLMKEFLKCVPQIAANTPNPAATIALTMMSQHELWAMLVQETKDKSPSSGIFTENEFILETDPELYISFYALAKKYVAPFVQVCIPLAVLLKQLGGTLKQFGNELKALGKTADEIERMKTAEKDPDVQANTVFSDLWKKIKKGDNNT